MKTNKIVITATLASLSMLVSCSADAPSTPRHETHFTAATAPLPYLLPEGTLLAVEIHDLARRWPEIRAVPPLELAGPVFAAVEGYVVTGSHESTLRTGVTLVENGTFSSRASNQEESIRAHASLWARGPSIAGWVESTLALSDGNSNHTALIGAVAGLIAGFVSAAARAWYEEDALRMHSEIMLDGLE